MTNLFVPLGATPAEAANPARRAQPIPDFGPGSPGFLEQMSAAFALENPTVAAIQVLTREPLADRVDPAFNPYEHLSPAEIRRFGRMIDQIRSPEALEEARRRLAIYEEQERTLASGPLPSWLAAMAAAVFSLDSALPLGWIARARTVRGMVAGGAAAGGAAGLAAEIPLQMAQPFRTEAEAVTSVLAGGAVGAGLFGLIGGAAALSARRRLRPMEEAVERAAGLEPGTTHRLETEATQALARAADPSSPTVTPEVAARLDEVYGPERNAGSVAGAQQVSDPGLRFILEEFRRERSELVNKKVLAPVFRSLGRFALTAVPGVTLASSRFATSRLFAHQFADVGLLPEAFRMAPVDKETIKRLVAKANKEGYAVGFDEAAHMLEQQTRLGGLSLSDRAPVLSRIAGDQERYLSQLTLARQDAYKTLVDDARAAGQPVPDITELDEMVARSMRAEDPRAGVLGDPLPSIPRLFSKAIAEYRQAAEGVLSELGQRIKASGIRDDVVAELGLEDALRNETFLPKVIDKQAARARPADFARGFERELRYILDQAKGRLETFEKAVREFKNQQTILRRQRAAMKARAKEALADAKAALDRPDREFHRTLAKDLNRLDGLLGKLSTARHERYKVRREIDLILDEADRGDPISALRANIQVEGPGGPSARRLQRLLDANKKVEDITAEIMSLHRLINHNLGPSESIDLTLPTTRAPEKYKNYDEDVRTVEALGIDRVTGEDRLQAAVNEAVDKVLLGPLEAPITAAVLRGSLRSRGINYDPIAFEPFLQKNAFQTLEQYVTMVTRDLAVHEQFGDVKGLGVLENLRKEYEAAVAAAKTDKERTRLFEDYKRESDMINALIQTARGQIGPHIPTRPWLAGLASVARNAATTAYTARLGSMLYSQFPDLATTTLHYGASRVFGTALRQFANGFADMRSVNLKYRSQLGIGLDNYLLTVQRDVSDVSLSAQHGESRFTRAVQGAGRVFSRATLGPLWNDAIRRLGVVISENMLLETAEKVARSPKALVNVDAKTKKLIFGAGLNADMLARIGNLFKKHGAWRDPSAPKDHNLRQSRYLEWVKEDPEAAQAFAEAVRFMAWKSLIQPTAVDTPLAFQNTVGTLILQFKKFPLASTVRLLARLTQEDPRTIAEVVVTGLALGAASLALRDLGTKGQIENRKPQEWAVKAVDRSGLLGILFELDTTASFALGGNSLQKLLSGKDPQFKRGAGQDVVSQVAGPVAGMVSDAFQTTTALARWAVGGPKGESRPPSRQEWREFRQLFPWQNHLVIRHLFDQLEQFAIEQSGSPAPRKPRQPS